MKQYTIQGTHFNGIVTICYDEAGVFSSIDLSKSNMNVYQKKTWINNLILHESDFIYAAERSKANYTKEIINDR